MIKIENLSVAFDGPEVVKNVTLEIQDGEILGVVGESGSGKSVTALTAMGLVSDTARVTSGRIVMDDCVLREAGKPVDKALYRTVQGNDMSMVFQEPMTSLNPTHRVGYQVEEMLKLHSDLTDEEVKEKVLKTFEAVGLRNVETVYKSYPHELSGGMRQRVMIAMAIILHPDLVVCDEPTTALDVTIQNQIVALLKEINIKERNSMLFITHDLNLARRICHRIAVMKDGRVVELGPTEEIFNAPKEEYTKRLIEAVPSRLKARVSAMKADTERVPIVQVKDLSVSYRDNGGNMFAKKKLKTIVSGATFDIYKGESLGLVGESGCGKTTLCKAILGMNKDIQGEVIMNTVRPQMIFQDPYSSLNPSKTIGWLLMEPLRARGKLDKSLQMTEEDMRTAAYEMLKRVGMEEKYFKRRPSELSGGQRQRVSIGQALITRPGLVVCDEPVSALDVTIQAQVMELMQKLQSEMELSYLFISHDINVVYHMCDRIMVMKQGKILEIGDTEEIFKNPQDEYTRTLLADSL